MKALLAALALASFHPAPDPAPHPVATYGEGKRFAQDVARNLGGGEVTRCYHHGRYLVICRIDLAVAPCHTKVHAHWHNGALYTPQPRFVYCGPWNTVERIA